MVLTYLCIVFVESGSWRSVKQTYETYNLPWRGDGISPIRAIIRCDQTAAETLHSCCTEERRGKKKEKTDNLDNSKCRRLDSFPNVNKAVSQLQQAAQYVNTTNKPISASHLGWQRFEREAVFYNKAAGHILNEA